MKCENRTIFRKAKLKTIDLLSYVFVLLLPKPQKELNRQFLKDKDEQIILAVKDNGNGLANDFSISTSKKTGLSRFDSFKIQQVLNNLVSNAIEYSQPHTEVTIDCSLNKDHLVVSITDQGPGILEQEISELFKPFTKTDKRKITGKRSTGLGLLISKKIIDAHQGRIWVESQLGQGAKFCVALPHKQDNR